MQTEHQRKLTAAFHELEVAGIPKYRSDPIFFRILRYFGLQVRPLHYMNIYHVLFVEIVLGFIDIVMLFFVINTVTTMLLDWPYEAEFMMVWIANQADLFDGIMIPALFIGSCIAGMLEFSTQKKMRRKHQLSHWDDL